MAENLEYKLQSRATDKQKTAREKLLELFQTLPLPPEHLIVKLRLYMRSSVVAKFFYINELYEKVVNIPVVAMDELNSFEFPGETIAFWEAFGSMNYRLYRSRFLSDCLYAVIE